MLRFTSPLLSPTMSEEKTHVPSLKDENQKRSTSSIDISVNFGGESSLPPPPTLISQQGSKLWRKVDIISLVDVCSVLPGPRFDLLA